MRIGLVGAPGSGKTKLARKLKNQMDGEWKIIDGYVSKLEKQTGLAYGHFANHVDNMSVGFKRYELEMGLDTESNAISCGTVVDTLTYGTNVAQPDVPREKLAYVLNDFETVLRAYGWMTIHMWNYDYVFYLPGEGRQDVSIRATLEHLALPVFQFKKDLTLAQQVDTAIGTITELEALAPAPAE